MAELDDKIAEVVGLFNANSESIDASIEPSVANVLCKVIAQMQLGQDIDIDLATSTPFDELTANEAYYWGGLRGVYPSYATKSSGVAKFFVSAGTVIESGAIMITTDGKEFATYIGVTASSNGALLLDIESVEAGIEFNISEGTRLSLKSPIDGVDDEGEAYSALAGGSDDECLDDYIERVRLAYRSLNGLNTRCDLESRIRREFPSLTKVYFEKTDCCYNVYVMSHSDDNESGIVSSGISQAVDDYLNSDCIMNECLCVESATLAPIEITINLTKGCYSANVSAIETLKEDLNNYVISNAQPNELIDEDNLRAIIDGYLGKTAVYTIDVGTMVTGGINVAPVVIYV